MGDKIIHILLLSSSFLPIPLNEQLSQTDPVFTSTSWAKNWEGSSMQRLFCELL